jgi:hypothetical protein
MAESEQSYLLELWEKSVCPNCGKPIPEGRRVGRGKRSDGGFCSFGCYGEYYKTKLAERHKKAMAVAEKYRNS